MVLDLIGQGLQLTGMRSHPSSYRFPLIRLQGFSMARGRFLAPHQRIQCKG